MKDNIRVKFGLTLLERKQVSGHGHGNDFVIYSAVEPNSLITSLRQ